MIFKPPEWNFVFQNFTLIQLFTNLLAFEGIQGHYFFHKTSALVPFLSKRVSAHILTNLIFKSQFNITVPSMPINNCRTSVPNKLCVFFLLHYVSTIESSQKRRSKIWILQEILATEGHSMLYWNRGTIIRMERLQQDSNEEAGQKWQKLLYHTTKTSSKFRYRKEQCKCHTAMRRAST
jgi:hypothetical protein